MKNARFLCFVSILAMGLCSFTERQIIQEKSFGAETLPFGGAYLVFAEKHGGEITKKELEGQRVLGVDGCARGSRIFSFNIEITHSGKTDSFSAESNALTPKMIAGLKALRVGDTFEFKKIKAYLPNGKDVVDVHSKKFVLVEKSV